MIIYQSEHPVTKLNVVRDIFNRIERRKFTCTKYLVLLNIAYHVIKIAIPMSTLISCVTLDVSDDECAIVTKHRI